jgi:hypothetical protein
MRSLNREVLLTLVLAMAAAALAFLVAAEWLLLDGARRRSAQTPPVRATGTLEAPPSAGPDFSLPALEAYPETVNRPLFMENRRPGVDVVEAPPPPAPVTPMNLKLMGVVQTPAGKTALLVDGKGKYQRKRTGDTLDSWMLVDIGSNQVTFQQGDKRESVTLLKKRPKAPNAPMGAPPMPGQPPGQPPRPGQAIPQPVGIPQPPMPPANFDNDGQDPGMEESPPMDEAYDPSAEQ